VLGDSENDERFDVSCSVLCTVSYYVMHYDMYTIALCSELGQGVVANDAEERKIPKYSALAANYTFTPIAIETRGALGSEASAFFSELGHRLHYVIREQCAYNVLDATHQCDSAA
jgi:hypothetical protein